MNNYNETNASNDEAISLMDLFDDIIKGIMKFHWLILFLLIVGMGVGFLRGVLFTSDIYEASSTYLVESQEAAIEERNEKTLGKQVFTTFQQVYESSNFQEQLNYNLGTNENPGELTVEMMEGSNFVTFKSQAKDPNTAYKLLQNSVSLYPLHAVYVVGKIQLQMMDDAGLPEAPMNQNRIIKNVMGGLIIGLIISCWIIAIYIYLRKTVVRPEDLKKYTSMRFLGSLPRVRFKKRSTQTSKIIELDNAYIPPEFTESLKIITNRVDREVKGHNLKSIMVTSAIPGEGKTTFTYNLAFELGKKGKKVILVDGDLRHPSLQGMRPSATITCGLESVLKNKEKLNKAIYHEDALPMDVIFVKKPQSKATELLGSRQMTKIIKELEEQYDVVIFDTAPSALLSDASELGRNMDSVVFLIKQDYAKAKHIVEGMNLLAENSNLWFIGCVLNQVPITNQIHRYGSSKYARYGYSRYYESKHKTNTEI